MKLSVSGILSLDECPQAWKNKWIEKRGRPPSDAQRLGTAAHTVLADLLAGKPRETVESLLPELWQEARPLDRALELWERTYGERRPWDEVLHIEEEMRWPIYPGLTVVGIPDAVVRWRDGVWHVQHKTVHASRPVSTFALGIRRSLHEAAYGAMLRTAGYAHRGTMLNVVRKLSNKAMDERPQEALHLEFVPITDRDIEEAELDVRHAAREMLRIKRGHRPYQRRTSCLGRYENSPCPYLMVCQGEKRLDSEDFIEINPMERYSPSV